MDLNTKVRNMMALLEDVERQANGFSGRTGLKCKNGCGACCATPHIETTVAEVLPMAEYLWAQGLAESKLEALRSNPLESTCTFYEPDPIIPTQGRCGQYAYRPGICRLFGFAARHDKHGQAVLMTCRVIKESQPQVCEQTQEELQKGLPAPLLTTLALRVADIDPINGQKILPINEAVRVALEKLGYEAENLK